MYKCVIILLLISSCTDKGEPIEYVFKNSTEKSFQLLLFEKASIVSDFKIALNGSSVVYTDKPPFDGPFAGIDSLRIIFEDGKILSYVPLISNDNCINAIKNPYCANFYNQCNSNSCIFQIDNIEYLKAK
jgi:hypothetical protein